MMQWKRKKVNIKIKVMIQWKRENVKMIAKLGYNRKGESEY